MSTPKILIVDDHQVVAEGLVRLLRDRFEIVGIINDGRLVLDSVGRLEPDVVLMDISMPNMSGLEATRQLKQGGFPSKSIVLTAHADANLAVEALKAGASGFVLKEASGDELHTALDVVLNGGTYLACGLTKEIVILMVGETDPRQAKLTTQQREVLRLLVRGLRAKEIATMLEMSTRNVDSIKQKTMQMLKVHSTAELVRYVVENRLVTF